MLRYERNSKVPLDIRDAVRFGRVSVKNGARLLLYCSLGVFNRLLANCMWCEWFSCFFFSALCTHVTQVLVLKGPDKGRTGKIVGIIKSRNEAIVRMDGTTREMRILELTDIARQLPDDPKMVAAASAASGTGGSVKKK